MHITLTLAANDIPQTPWRIDQIISLEIPDKETDLLAYETVIRYMLHGPFCVAYQIHRVR